MGTLQLLTAEGAADGHAGEVFGCAYSHDGGLLLSAGWDGHLRAWDPGTLQPVAALQVGHKPLSSCAFSPDGQLWLSGSMEGMLTAHDAGSQQVAWAFIAHTRPISAIHYAPDGQLFATASWDRRVALRALGKEREPKVLAGHRDIVAGCQFTPDGKRLLSWSYDGAVRLWDVNLGREAAILGEHGTRVTAGAVSPGGRWAVSGGINGGIKLWDLDALAEAGSADLPTEVRGLFFLADADSFLVLDAEGMLTLLTAPTFDLQDQLTLGTKALCGDLAPAGDRLAVGGEDGRVRFVAIEGFDQAALVVAATKGFKDATTLFDRLLGKTRAIPTFQFTCPTCRHTNTSMGDQPPDAFPCPGCGRVLRIGTLRAQLQSR